MNRRVSGKVAILGHSYITRLAQAISQNDKFNHEFGLEGVEVKLWGRPGGRIMDVDRLIDEMKHSGYRPHVTIIQIGGNDLDDPSFEISRFLGVLQYLVSRLEAWGVQRIVIMKLFPRIRLRRVSSIIYNQRRVQVNLALARTYRGHVSFESRKRLLNPHLLSDGVHLGRVGMRRYYHELKWLMVKKLRSL